MAAGALRAFKTETIVARLRDLEFDDTNPVTAWRMLSANPIITADVILALPHKPWDVNSIYINPHLSRSDAKRICAALGGCPVPDEFADRPDVQFADVAGANASSRARRLFAWRNPNMTLDLYLAHQYDSEFRFALMNPAVVNARVLREHPEFPWAKHANLLAKNSGFDDEAMRVLEARVPKMFAASDGLLSQCLRFGKAQEFWDWHSYSSNPALTWKTVARHRDKPWNMYGLSQNPAVVDYDRWCAMPDGLGHGLAWDWDGLSANSAFATWERVREHPDWPWKAEFLARNPNAYPREAVVTFKETSWPLDAIYFWRYVRLFRDADRDAWARRWFAARHIQRAWLRAYYTPHTPIWRRRMAREFAALTDERAIAARRTAKTERAN